MTSTSILWITTLTASLLGLLYLRLSLAVIRLRQAGNISIGDGENDALARAIRVHANFAEYVPISLILLAVLEFNAGPVFALIPLALALVLGRLLHSRGLSSDSKATMKNRVLGMRLTLYNLIALCVVNVLWTLYRLLAG